MSVSWNNWLFSWSCHLLRGRIGKNGFERFFLGHPQKRNIWTFSHSTYIKHQKPTFFSIHCPSPANHIARCHNSSTWVRYLSKHLRILCRGDTLRVNSHTLPMKSSSEEQLIEIGFSKKPTALNWVSIEFTTWCNMWLFGIVGYRGVFCNQHK